MEEYYFGRIFDSRYCLSSKGRCPFWCIFFRNGRVFISKESQTQFNDMTTSNGYLLRYRAVILTNANFQNIISIYMYLFLWINVTLGVIEIGSQSHERKKAKKSIRRRQFDPMIKQRTICLCLDPPTDNFEGIPMAKTHRCTLTWKSTKMLTVSFSLRTETCQFGFAIV